MVRASSIDNVDTLVVITKSDITQNDVEAQERIDQIKKFSKMYLLPCIEASSKTNDKIALIKDWTVNVTQGLEFDIEETLNLGSKHAPKSGGCSIS